MPDEFERRSRLVVLAYSVLDAMDPPTPETSDQEILSAIADVALQKAADAEATRPQGAGSSRRTRPPVIQERLAIGAKASAPHGAFQAGSRAPPRRPPSGNQRRRRDAQSSVAL
jgi:hypothetical protein